MNKAIDSQLQQKLEQWLNDLADLGKRNHLLYFQKDKKSTTKIPKPAVEIFEKLVIQEQSISLNDLGNDEIESIKINKSLTTLHKDAKSIFKEKGVHMNFMVRSSNFKENTVIILDLRFVI